LSTHSPPEASAITFALRDDRDGLEVEAVKGLADRQAGLGEMALGAPPAALGDLVPEPSRYPG
jgi:hypothetical protein